jgi:hypothetical protein
LEVEERRWVVNTPGETIAPIAITEINTNAEAGRRKR